MPYIQVHIITGFLGVGKTSCIQHLISIKPEHERWAILINEYGQKGIDGHIIQSDDVIIKQIAGGCACCAAILPFQIALNQLIQHEKIDRILIEPSGLGHADNLATLLQENSYQSHLQLNGVVCIIDPRHLSQPKYRYHELYLRQLYAADLLVANKCEIVSDDDLLLFDKLAIDFKRPSLKIRQAQIKLDDINCQIIEKHKPFQIHNDDLLFHSQVIYIEGTRWQLKNMMDELASFKLSRVKGLFIQGDQVAVININETEKTLSYFPLKSLKNNQSSVVECIDVKPINMSEIRNTINQYRLD